MKGYATLFLSIGVILSLSRGLDYRNYYNGTLLGYHSQIFNL